MNIRLAYLFLLAIVGFSCTEEQKPPNIILIVADDQGYGDVGFHGNEIVKTPRLDAFSQEAIELANFHTGTTCSPTRAGIMTGRNSNRNGAWHTIAGASILNPDEQTIAEVFQAAGYKTAMFGKWHLGDNYPYRPHDRGFDKAFYHGGGGVQQTPDYWNNKYFDDTYFRNGIPEKTSGYCTDVWFDELIAFIDENKKESRAPFFAYVPTNAAHGPFNVPEKYHKMYKDAPLEQSQVNFYGMLTNLDDNFGRLEDYLKKEGLFENTILIYTTDNGTARGVVYQKEPDAVFGFNPLRGTKGSHYDGGHKVPFLLSWPAGNVLGGTKVNDLTAHVDLLPTLSTLAGIPFTPKKELDGTDVSGLILGTETRVNRMLVIDTQRDQWPKKYKSPCVMDGPWRLINHKELYNTENDLAQKVDLAGQFPERVKKMQEFYDNWWESTETDWTHSPMFIGSESSYPMTITIHDMHPLDGGGLPWNQNQIRNGNINTTGYYSLQVDQPGSYQFQLSRWPVESGFTLHDSVPEIPATDFIYGLNPGKSISFSNAFISSGHHTDSVMVDNSQQFATIELELSPQDTLLQAWFTTKEGEYFPVHYIYVERM
ncbi:MAG: arylsulfatase [Bacteroidota bacterium]